MDRIEIMYRLSAFFRKDDDTGAFVSCCPALEIFSQGKTEEDAKRALTSAVTLYIKHCHKRGIFERVLSQRGGQIINSGELPSNELPSSIPAMKNAKPFDLSVSLDYLIARNVLDASAGQRTCIALPSFV
jgi:predicted RNase H-like HicB family nuclease